MIKEHFEKFRLHQLTEMLMSKSELWLLWDGLILAYKHVTTELIMISVIPSGPAKSERNEKQPNTNHDD